MENAIVFCADFVGLKCLEYLIQSGERIDFVVVTRRTPEIAALSSVHGIECVADFEDSRALDSLKQRRFRWLLNLWGTMVLSQEILALGERRLNIHPGIVPQNRGSDCATWVIRDETPAGVSLLDITEELDAGGIYVEQRVDASLPISGLELAERLKSACIELFKREWPSIREGAVKPLPQSGGSRCFTRAETVGDRVRNLDTDATTRSVVRWLLAHDFAPHSRPQLVIDGKRFEVELHLEAVADDGQN